MNKRIGRYGSEMAKSIYACIKQQSHYYVDIIIYISQFIKGG